MKMQVRISNSKGDTLVAPNGDYAFLEAAFLERAQGTLLGRFDGTEMRLRDDDLILLSHVSNPLRVVGILVCAKNLIAISGKYRGVNEIHILDIKQAWRSYSIYNPKWEFLKSPFFQEVLRGFCILPSNPS